MPGDAGEDEGSVEIPATAGEAGRSKATEGEDTSVDGIALEFFLRAHVRPRQPGYTQGDAEPDLGRQPLTGPCDRARFTGLSGKNRIEGVIVLGSEYSIRRATSADLETLVDFAVREARETEGAPPDPDAVRRGVESGLNGSAPAEYWVAEAANGPMVGAISVVTEWSNFRGGYYWWIQSLYLLPEHRGTGLVDRLLEFTAEQAREHQALDLRLYVLQSNERAVAAYRRCGFEVAPYAIMSRSLG